MRRRLLWKRVGRCSPYLRSWPASQGREWIDGRQIRQRALTSPGRRKLWRSCFVILLLTLNSGP
jgi:hypothetical protein